MKTIREWHVQKISDGATTEKGEKVYTSLEITLCPPAQNEIRKFIVPDEGIGFTEEWIEETVQGCLTALKRDFPNDTYNPVRIKPNIIRFVWLGPAGMVN